MSETNIVQECRMAASACGAVAFRNNQGAFKDSKGRWVKYGVGQPGGSDLIGWTADGRFLAMEVKTPGWKPSSAADKERFEQQMNFINQVINAGGVAGIVRCAADVRDLLK